MTVTKEIVGTRIKEARENARLTQDKLAQLVGLDRSVIGKIEIGARSVTGLEIDRFARVFGRNPQELVSLEPLKADPLLLFRSIALEDDDRHRQEIADCIDLLREARMLEQYLGCDEPDLPEGYTFPRMRTFVDAVRQGQEMAQRERERLGIGHAPIPDIADLVIAQGIRAAAVPLIEDVSGIFIMHDELGAAILVNQFSSHLRCRFSYAHEYAHALTDRNEPSSPSSRTNAKTLTEARANAFAGEFLVPEAGVWALLDRFKKGELSRFHQALYSPAAEEIQPYEGRNNPETQKVTNREIAALAHHYQVSAEVVIYRLLDIGAVRKPEKEALLEQKIRIRELINLLKFYDAEASDNQKPGGTEQPYLRKQIIFIAIEALRRDRIQSARFRDICLKTGYPASALLDALGVVTEED